MLIKRLIVRKTKPQYEIIRDIEFNLDGLSLIVDSTTDISEDSGNSVGKTTVIKIIDLCLGASSVRTLYFDSGDTRSENTDIKNFLHENRVEAELILLDKKEEKTVSVIRQLYNKGKRKINNEERTEDEFEEELKKIVFDLNESYPKLRELIPKFIRVNDTTADSMIKYLHSSTPADKYDTIYLFLFRILSNELLSKKDSLNTNMRACKKKLEYYQKDKNIFSLDYLEQRKELIEKDLSELKHKRKKLDYMETYKEELQKKRNLLTNIDNLEEQVQLIEFDINLINKSIETLKKEKSNINTSKIKRIYNEAKIYIREVEKTYDDVIKFHNSMIENRIKFITSQLESKNIELEQVISSRDLLIEEKKKITIELLDEGFLDELNELNSKIDEFNLEKGKIIQSIEILTGAEEEIKSLDFNIKSVTSQMSPENIKEKIAIFNTYFSAYCEEMYGEKYLFVYNNKWKEQKSFPVSIDHFKGNVGTGKKKGIIVAFDLAYMKYAEKMGIKAPQFVIHDKLENTHINQLRTIFDLCQKINGQYIVPILRERVDKVDVDLIERAKVLELSTDNKFFMVN